jgi:hypothetical protein
MGANSAGARTAPRFLWLPEPAAENARIAGKEINPFLLRQKDVLTGTTGGVSS